MEMVTALKPCIRGACSSESFQDTYIDPESSLPALSSASLQNLLICLPSLNLLMVLTHLIDGIYILMYPALLD